jgi:hypothetical protein
MITIIMPTYKRNVFLSDIKHPTLNLVKNNLIFKLIIIWQNIDKNIPKNILGNINALNIQDKVEFKFPIKNSLNNRFCYYEDLTECIISVDDDYIFSEKAMIECYKNFILDNDILVGIVPRFMNSKIYHGNAANKNNNIEYNMILTGGAMFHKKYLKKYSSNVYVNDLIEETFNGEDIAFNYIHRKFSNKLPLYIHDDNVKTWKQIRGNSISDKHNYLNERKYVFNTMKSKYGDILSSTKRKIIV